MLSFFLGKKKRKFPDMNAKLSCNGILCKVFYQFYGCKSFFHFLLFPAYLWTELFKDLGRWSCVLGLGKVGGDLINVCKRLHAITAVSYTHLTLPTMPDV